MASCKTFFNRLTSYISNPIILKTRQILPSYQQYATVRVNEFPKYGIPLPPKRPLCSFFKFKQMVYPKLKAENPNTRVADILKLVSEEWLKYPDEKKELLKQECDQDYIVYKQDVENYKKSLTPEDLENLKKAKHTNILKKKFEARKQKRIEFDKPKRPLSAYCLYFREKIGDRKNISSYAEEMKLLGEAWKTESFEVKKKFRQMYEKEKLEYKQKLSEWENKMIELGHFDLLGTKTLRKAHKAFKERQLS